MNLAEFTGLGDVNLHLTQVERYLTASKEDYSPPPIPVDLPDHSDLRENPPTFGEESRKFFYLSDEFIFLNHGALGCSLKSALDMSQAYERYLDSQPLKAIDREMIPLLCHVRRQMAEFVGCEAQDLFFVDNASAGINTILKSLTFTSEDKILTTSLGYGAVGFAVDSTCERTGATRHDIQIDYPISGPDQIVEKVRAGLVDGIKLAIFDHIPSNSAFILPIKELIEMCKARGIMVMIDAAHSLGQLDIAIESYGADFYVTNCHKWFSNTRGSALAYVRRELQPHIHPLVTSWGHNRGFAAEFTWNGTAYYSQYIALLNTINFWNSVGGDAIRNHGRSVIRKAVHLCYEKWNVEPLCPDEMLGMMALVRLPDKLNDPEWKTEAVKKDLVVDTLYFTHKIEVPIRDVDGILYTRLSCHIYNQFSHYEKLVDAVLDMCENRDSLVDCNSQFNKIPKSVGWS